VKLSPLFDTRTRFKPKQTVKLKFEAVEAKSGAPIGKGNIFFFLRHPLKKSGNPLAARAVKAGVFEVPFTPEGPGQYSVLVQVRGAQLGSIPPVRLGVVGVVDGLIEVPPEKDAEIQQRARTAGFHPGR
jgi:hypothetical protein